jgi:hypothetical protein
LAEVIVFGLDGFTVLLVYVGLVVLLIVVALILLVVVEFVTRSATLPSAVEPPALSAADVF